MLFRSLRALAPALILLGVCVFAWGLRYKLSFYSPPHSVTRRMPEAKLLLTDRSASPAVALHRAADHVAPQSILLFVPLLLVLTGMNFWPGREWALERGRVYNSPLRFRGSSGFIRPPPPS